MEGEGCVDEEMDGFAVPPRIRQSRRRENVRNFRHDRPVHRGDRSKNNEFKVTDLQNRLSLTLI